MSPRRFPITPVAAFTAVVGIALMVAGAARAADTIEGSASVVNGDRIDIAGKRIHLAGVDAPEPAQICTDAREKFYTCGRAAEIALAEKVVGRRIVCERTPDDRSVPAVALCRLGTEDLGAWLVDQGLAVADRTQALRYAAEEEAAKAGKRGLWAGAFTMPWDVRRGVRGKPDGYAMPIGTALVIAPPKEARKPECVIKGNITREGTKLYWVPGSRRYAETTITEDTGERWFCTEDEAKAAGWGEPAKVAPTP